MSAFSKLSVFFLLAVLLGNIPAIYGNNSDPSAGLGQPGHFDQRVDVASGVHYKNFSAAADWQDPFEVKCAEGSAGGMSMINRSDDFNDNSLNMARWRTAGSVGSTLTETGQRLELSIPSSTNAENAYAAQDISEDFDFTVDYSIVSWDSSLDVVYGAGFTVDLGPGYNQIYCLRAVLGTDNDVYQVGEIDSVSGSSTAWGTTMTSDTSGGFRFYRTGTVYTAETWTGSSWSLLGFKDMGGTYNSYGAVALALWSTRPTGLDDNPYVKVAFDELKVNSGPAYYDDAYWTYDYHAEGDAHLIDYALTANTPTNTNYGVRFKTASDKDELNTTTWTTWFMTSTSSIPATVGDGSWVRIDIALASTTQAVTPVISLFSLRYTLIPQPSTLLAPGNNAWGNSTPVFSWRFNDTDAGDTQTAFQLQLDDVSTFLSPNYDSGTLSSVLTSWQYPQATALSAIADGTWYWRVRVQDNHGGWSKWSTYNTLKVESLKPSATITTPSNGASLPVLTQMTGSASDTGGSGLQKIEVRISQPGPLYWNGSAWQSGEVWLAATGTATWSLSGLPLWYPDTPYTVSAMAWDNANNLQSPVATNAFNISASGIASWITSPADLGYYNAMPLISGGAADTTGGSVSKVLVRLMDSDSACWNGSAWTTADTWLLANGTTSWSLDLSGVLLETGVRYSIASRAFSTKGVVEAIGAGVSFTFDDVAPQVEITWPTPGMRVYRLTYIEGNAVDSGGGYVDHVFLTVNRDANDTWWNGHSWNKTQTAVEASFVPDTLDPSKGKFVLGDGLPPMDWDTNAVVTVWAQDPAGNSGGGLNGTRGALNPAAQVLIAFMASANFAPPSFNMAKNLDPMDVDEFLDNNPSPTLGDWYAWVLMCEVAQGTYGGPINIPYEITANAMNGTVEIEWGLGSGEHEFGSGWSIADRVEVNLTLEGSIVMVIKTSSEGSIDVTVKGSISIKLNAEWFVGEFPIPYTVGILWGKFTLIGYVEFKLEAEGGQKFLPNGTTEGIFGVTLSGEMCVGMDFEIGLEQTISSFVAVDLRFSVALTLTLFEKKWGDDKDEAASPGDLTFSFTIETEFQIMGKSLWKLTLYNIDVSLLERAKDKCSPGKNVSADELARKGGRGSRASLPYDHAPTDDELKAWLDGLTIFGAEGSSDLFDGQALAADRDQSGPPAVATSDDGQVLVAWTQQPENTAKSVVKAKLWDGADWKTLPDVVKDDQWNGDPAVCFDGKGEPLVVWPRAEVKLASGTGMTSALDALNDIELAWSALRDGTWSEPVMITNDTSPDADPALASDGSGNVVLVWNKETLAARTGKDVGALEEREVWACTFTHDGFDPAERISSEGEMTYAPDVAFSKPGYATAVWPGSAGDGAVGLSYSDQTEGWNTAKELEAGGNAAGVSLAGDGNGNLALAYLTDTGLYGTLSFRLRTSGWGAEQVVTQDVVYGKPDVAFDDAGNPLVVWSNKSKSQDGDIWMARLVLGVWTQPLNITMDDVNDTFPIVATGSATPLVWCKAGVDGERDLYYQWLSASISDVAFSAAASPGVLEIRPGDSGKITVNIRNIGKDDVKVGLSASGVDASWLILPKDTTVGPGSNVTLEIQVKVPKNAKQQVYALDIAASGGGVERKMSVDLNVTAKTDGVVTDDDDDAKPDDNGPPLWVFILLAAVALFCILAIIIAVVVMRRRGRADAAEGTRPTDKQPQQPAAHPAAQAAMPPQQQTPMARSQATMRQPQAQMARQQAPMPQAQAWPQGPAQQQSGSAMPQNAGPQYQPQQMQLPEPFIDPTVGSAQPPEPMPFPGPETAPGPVGMGTLPNAGEEISTEATLIENSPQARSGPAQKGEPDPFAGL